jgi:fluoride ion exporter CrcB/FEX
MAYLLLFIGGGIGTVLRHGVNVAFARWFGSGQWSLTMVYVLASVLASIFGLVLGLAIVRQLT